MNFTIYIGAWAALAAVVLALALTRFFLARQEDDNIHLRADQADLVASQRTLASRMETVERWGKSLTLVTLVSGLGIACVYLNQVFQGVRP